MIHNDEDQNKDNDCDDDNGDHDDDEDENKDNDCGDDYDE